MFLFALYIPGDKTSADTDGYDDCAVCRAWTKKRAMLKFKKMYRGFDGNSVKKVRYNAYGIAVISKY